MGELRLDTSKLSLRIAQNANRDGGSQPIVSEGGRLSFFPRLLAEPGEGCWGKEGNDADNWRWCGRHARIDVVNASNSERRIGLDATFATGHPADSTLTIEGAGIQQKLTINNAGTPWQAVLTVPPGEHTIRLSSDADQVLAPGDPRDMFFRIGNFRFYPVGGELHNVQTQIELPRRLPVGPNFPAKDFTKRLPVSPNFSPKLSVPPVRVSLDELRGRIGRIQADVCRDVSSPRRVVGLVLIAVRKLFRWLLKPFFGRQILLNGQIQAILQEIADIIDRDAEIASRSLSEFISHTSEFVNETSESLVSLSEFANQTSESLVSLSEFANQTSDSLSEAQQDFRATFAKLNNIDREILFFRRRQVSVRENLNSLTRSTGSTIKQQFDLMNEQSEQLRITASEVGQIRRRLQVYEGSLSLVAPKLTSTVSERWHAPVPAVPVDLDTAGMLAWYPPAMIGPTAIGALASQSTTVRKAMDIATLLERDSVIEYLLRFYEFGISQFGSNWAFADINTVLVAIAELIQPRNYLEVGVFHGKSMSMLAGTCPTCDLVGFDMWIEGYAGLDNTGPHLVNRQLKQVGHLGKVNLISGDSHKTLPQFFADHPALYFDVITVDGDHTVDGATQDLLDTMIRLKVGGFLVFDDLVHPAHRDLLAVWQRTVVTDPKFVAWTFQELGNGVGVAMRLCP